MCHALGMIHTLVAMANIVTAFSVKCVLGQKKQFNIKAWLAWLPSKGMFSVRYMVSQTAEHQAYNTKRH
jgi:hypothetical protein